MTACGGDPAWRHGAAVSALIPSDTALFAHALLADQKTRTRTKRSSSFSRPLPEPRKRRAEYLNQLSRPILINLQGLADLVLRLPLGRAKRAQLKQPLVSRGDDLMTTNHLRGVRSTIQRCRLKAADLRHVSSVPAFQLRCDFSNRELPRCFSSAASVFRLALR